MDRYPATRSAAVEPPRAAARRERCRARRRAAEPWFLRTARSRPVACGHGLGSLGGAPPGQYAQSGGQLLGSERGGHRDLDPFGSEQCGDAGGVDEHVVVGLVVAAPGAVAGADEGGDLAYEPGGCGQRESGDDRPVVGDAGGGRGVVPGLPVGKVADVDGEQAAWPQCSCDRGERLVDGVFIGQD